MTFFGMTCHCDRFSSELSSWLKKNNFEQREWNNRRRRCNLTLVNESLQSLHIFRICTLNRLAKSRLNPKQIENPSNTALVVVLSESAFALPTYFVMSFSNPKGFTANYDVFNILVSDLLSKLSVWLESLFLLRKIEQTTSLTMDQAKNIKSHQSAKSLNDIPFDFLKH